MQSENKIPEINIIYGKFLDPIFIEYLKSVPGWKDWTPPETKFVKEKIEIYKKEWSEYGYKNLEEICNLLNLNFRRDVIDVYIVSGNNRQFSDPIVIRCEFKPKYFVDFLTHELIHRLFQINSDKFPYSTLKEMFPNESKTTRNHIFVHAILKYIYLDVLNDKSRLERNIERSKEHNTDEYTKAWEIVDKEGYKNLINKLKEKIKDPRP